MDITAVLNALQDGPNTFRELLRDPADREAIYQLEDDQGATMLHWFAFKNLEEEALVRGRGVGVVISQQSQLRFFSR